MKKEYLAVCAAFLFAAFLAVETYGQALERLSAQYLRFDFTETACTAGSGCVPATGSPAGGGGRLVYSHPVFVPLGGSPVLYVDFAAQADQHGGSAEYISCVIDDNTAARKPCNAGTGGAGGAPAGWVNFSHHFQYNATYCNGVTCGNSAGDGGGGNGDEHDNTIYAHWCVHVTPGTHTVSLRLGTNAVSAFNPVGTPTTVFFEAAHIFIDANTPLAGNDCTKAPDL
jgi:hypothetical protein